MPGEQFNTLLRNPHQLSSQSIAIGQLFIDSQACCAKLDERLIHLTKLEFNVLVYLARNRGRVVSASELLQEVWGCCPETGGTSAQTKNCIKRLRGKIERQTLNARAMCSPPTGTVTSCPLTSRWNRLTLSTLPKN